MEEAFSTLVHKPLKSASVTIVDEALVYLFHSFWKPAQVEVVFQKYCSLEVAQYQSREVWSIEPAGREMELLTVRVSMLVVVAFNTATLASAIVVRPFKVAPVMVGLVPKTSAPVPVSSVTIAASSAEVSISVERITLGSKYDGSMAVPCQTPVLIVPKVVILVEPLQLFKSFSVITVEVAFNCVSKLVLKLAFQ